MDKETGLNGRKQKEKCLVTDASEAQEVEDREHPLLELCGLQVTLPRAGSEGTEHRPWCDEEGTLREKDSPHLDKSFGRFGH